MKYSRSAAMDAGMVSIQAYKVHKQGRAMAATTLVSIQGTQKARHITSL